MFKKVNDIYSKSCHVAVSQWELDSVNLVILSSIIFLFIIYWLFTYLLFKYSHKSVPDLVSVQYFFTSEILKVKKIVMIDDKKKSK